jgi:uncharacterized protein (TIGR00299 family) protein
MKAIYFQTLCGASGDMILSTLIDCGVPIHYLQAELTRTGIEGLSIETERLTRGGVSCRHMLLSWTTQKEYRHLPLILDIIRKGGYPDRVVARCTAVLERIAKAEAQVHGVSVEKVHFHEIGAADTIVDVLGAALCLEYLGVEELFFSTLTEGYGTITMDHGVMPVPAPATAAMLTGFACQTLDIPTEILTPTGCALLTALGEQRPEGVSGKVCAIGYGCGDKTFGHHPNYLRGVLMESAGSSLSQTVCLIETNLDHVTGEVMGFTAEELFSRGALDVAWTPIIMKKGRPGYSLAVMCTAQQRDTLIDCIMRNTRTLGVRYQELARKVAVREPAVVAFSGRDVAAKNHSWGDRTFTKLEYEACAALARERCAPLIEVMEEWVREAGIPSAGTPR